MKALLLSAAAIAAVTMAPAIAQTAAPAAGAHHKVTTRAEMLQKVQQHFARMDADRDGSVTKAEAQSARSAMRGHRAQRMPHHPRAMFDHMDTDKNGSISRAEFEAAHQKTAGRNGKGDGKGRGMHGLIFRIADTNNDGRVTLQEATAAATAHFDRADANRDGTLTPDEKRSARQAMRSVISR